MNEMHMCMDGLQYFCTHITCVTEIIIMSAFKLLISAINTSRVCHNHVRTWETIQESL